MNAKKTVNCFCIYKHIIKILIYVFITDISDNFNCYTKCIENLYNKSFECLPNPYINEEFILMNASQTQYRICDHNMNTNYTEYSVIKKYCKEKCVKNCDQKYYSLELEDNTYSAQNDSKIRIEFKRSQEFHYKSDKKYSFVDFMSNIGGIVGLWFWMSFIDTSALIRLMLNIILRRLKILYLRLPKLPRLKKLATIIIK